MLHTKEVEGIGSAEYDEDAVTLEVEGELDIESGETLKHTVHGVLEQGARKLRIDLTPTTFVDSAGLAALVAAANEVRDRRCELRVHSPKGSEARVFIDLTGLQSLLCLTDEPLG
jgi:anti-sigma B factor antagonist/stage II sporulation protein AA (anti-sigma F factor antagonist)